MNKVESAEVVSDKTGIAKKEARNVIDAITDTPNFFQ